MKTIPLCYKCYHRITKKLNNYSIVVGCKVQPKVEDYQDKCPLLKEK